jgi:2,3-dihydroxybenzoate-AMP ligase
MTIACLRLGVAPVMALPAHRRHELEHLAHASSARALVVIDQFRGFDHQAMATEVVDNVASIQQVVVVGNDIVPRHISYTELATSDNAPDRASVRSRLDDQAPSSRDVAVILLSGGTTGLPKLIARTHDDYEYNARRSSEVCGFNEDTVYQVVLPIGHNFPLACPGILGTLLVGGRVVLVDSPEPGTAFRAMHQEGVTHVATVPAVAQRWLEAVESSTGSTVPESLRVVQVGGARLPVEVARRIRPVFGCSLQQVFGMAEGLLNYTRLDDPDDVICETQGRPMSEADEVRIVDDYDESVAHGEPGNLLTRGPYTPRGYLQADEHNARAFTPDGWYRTGDVVRVDDSGNFVVLGRTKDLINRGGEKISAEEIENLVHAVAPVAQVAAVAMPDPDVGERICLYAVPRSGEQLDLDHIRTAFEQRDIARFKLPERLEIVDALPVTNVGKIDKQALRRDIAERLSQ